MGQIRTYQQVKLIVGMISSVESLFEQAAAAMEKWWGDIDIRSEVMPFEYTEYYIEQMGTRLLRQFVSFAELIDPAALALTKQQSNTLEAEIAESESGRALGVARPINLDPGYIEPSKLVLATTKNYSHRVYIGFGMYAEATLRYHKERWHGWPFTYPDYNSGDYDKFLNQARQRLMEQLSSRKANT